MCNRIEFNPTTEQAISDGRQFLADVNRACNVLAQSVEDDEDARARFWVECTHEQIKRVDPRARSYGIVHQLIATDPRMW